ncbi:MAG TPA: ABC transporter permease, partial [Candidatus Sumerlaeia bacterium]|nr:ABC transporter permease [Candidatus Sumerlaeia bacterium]
MLSLFKRIEAVFSDIFLTAGGMVLLLGECIIELKYFASNARRIIRQMMEVGWNTLPLASMIGLFTGMITSLQTGVELKNLGLQQQVGTIVGLSLVREMGPV